MLDKLDTTKIRALAHRWGAFVVVVVLLGLGRIVPMNGLYLFWGVILAAGAMGSVLELEPGLLLLPILGGCVVWLLLFGMAGALNWGWLLLWLLALGAFFWVGYQGKIPHLGE